MDIGVAYAVTPGWPKMEWVATAFERIGHTVRRIHKDRDKLFSSVKECDLLVLAHKSIGGRWPNVKDALAARECPVVYWWFDLVATHPGVALASQPMFDQFRDQFTTADVVLVKERGMLGEYRAAGVNAFWFDQGAPPDSKEPPKPSYEWDVLLWGQCAPWKQRVRDVKAAIKAGFKVAWASDAGNLPEGVVRLPWVHPDDLNDLASKARCVMSCGFRNDVEGYWSDGFWMAAATGRCLLRRATPGLPEGPHCVYRCEDTFCDLIRWVKNNPDQAEESGERTRRWAITEHSLEKRAEQLIKLVRHAKEKGTFSLPSTRANGLDASA